jgi:hypothetical protein
MTPSIARRRVMLGRSSRLLGAEQLHVYEHAPMPEKGAPNNRDLSPPCRQRMTK